MIGENLPLLLPPGINSDMSRYMSNASWYDGNLVRWNDSGVLEPVGGWQKLYDISGPTTPIRALHSWSDNSAVPYLAMGSLETAMIRKVSDGTSWNATPSDLTSTPSGAVGYGSGSFGTGRYGLDSSNNSGGGSDSRFDYGYWTFDNWGQNLIAVHSNDGRLLQWDPSTPTTDLATVTNAPIGNRLCISTDERHVMVMGGSVAPRRVKWCSQEDITLWTAAADNSAGGWELDTHGEIVAAVKVPQGILVATDADIHLIEYIGPPYYYSRRLVTDETGVVSPRGLVPTPNGAIIVGPNGFWNFNGGVSKIPCTLSREIFVEGNLTQADAVFIGINEAKQEVWFFYPGRGEVETNRCAIYKYAGNAQWWSKGEIVRTAWLNPVWSDKPIAANNLAIYEHESGWTDDGSTREIYAETGDFDLSNGDMNMSVKRIFHDTILDTDYVAGDPIPYEIEFTKARSPQGTRTTYGPVELNVSAGYTALRFKTRQISMKVNQTVDSYWGLGKTRLTVHPVGKR